jgi:PAS domain S-box-containing protein
MNPNSPPDIERYKDAPAAKSGPPGRIVGTGEMADRVRAYDWIATPLGPIENWSKELVTIVNLTLCSPSPARTMWGPEFILIYNDSYRPIPGKRHPWALGKPAREIYGEAWHVVGPLLETAMHSGETCYYQKLAVPLESEDGTVRDRYLNYSFNPIYEGGKIAGLFGSLHDVTDEVLAAHKLRESEDRLSRILQSIGDAVIVTDADARVTRMNPVAESLTGWTASEALARPLSEVFHVVDEESRQVAESPVERVKRLGTVTGLPSRTILIRRDGTEGSIDDSGAPVRDDDGNLTGIVLVFRDVKEQRREAEALRESEARLSAMYSASLEYIGLLTPEGVIVHCNDASLEFAGNRREEVVGLHFADAPWWINTPGAAELLRQWIARAASGELIRAEASLRRPSGEVVVFDFSLTPARNAQGAVVFLVPEGRDITELKRAQGALLQSEKLAAVGRLASSIAHEINNPLEAVMNLVYLARKNAITPDAIRYLDLADAEIRRVSIIANQTLRFHKQPSNPQAANCLELYTTVLGIYEGKLRNARILVEKRFRSEQPVVCFQGDIRQVLNNLVGNAIDAMASGGRLLLRSRKGTDWATGRQGLVLTVADTGEGIAPENMGQIFEAFFTTKGIGGTGLGLWVSQEIVQRHNAALRARSSRSRQHGGTVFTLFLPFDTELR